MKRLKNVLAIVLCVFMVAALFAGCGSGDKGGDTASPSPSASTAPSAEVSADTSAAPSPAVDRATMTGKLSIWHFNKDEAPKIEAAYKKTFPKVELKLSLVSDKDSNYLNKITQAIRSGSGVPDIFSAESAMVARLVNMPDGYLDITDKAKEISGDMAPYTIEVGTSTDGKVRALSHQVTPGGIAYKRPLAKQYFGTDDPAKVAELLSSQETILSTAKTVKEKSSGKVCLFPGWMEMEKIALGGRSQGWVVDGKLTIDQKVLDLIDFSKQMRDNKYEAGFDAWSTGWAASIANDGQAMCYTVPTWGVPYIVGSNDPKAKGSGKWGIANAPFPYFWGGTWYGIYSKSPNQDTAWEFIKWFTADQDHLKEWSADTGDIPNSKTILSTNAADAAQVNDIMGVNLFAFYQPLVEKINGKILTIYDDTIENGCFNDVMKSYLAGKIKTKEDVLKAFKDKVKANLKDVTVE